MPNTEFFPVHMPCFLQLAHPAMISSAVIRRLTSEGAITAGRSFGLTVAMLGQLRFNIAHRHCHRGLGIAFEDAVAGCKIEQRPESSSVACTTICKRKLKRASICSSTLRQGPPIVRAQRCAGKPLLCQISIWECGRERRAETQLLAQNRYQSPC